MVWWCWWCCWIESRLEKDDVGLPSNFHLISYSNFLSHSMSPSILQSNLIVVVVLTMMVIDNSVVITIAMIVTKALFDFDLGLGLHSIGDWQIHR